jgi:uncharacterized protein YlbG (UPF0298 family)
MEMFSHLPGLQYQHIILQSTYSARGWGFLKQMINILWVLHGTRYLVIYVGHNQIEKKLAD